MATRHPLMAIPRKGRSLPVAGSTLLEQGDELTVLVPAEHTDDLTDRFGIGNR